MDELIDACAANYDKLQSWQVRSTQLIQGRGSWRGTERVHAYDIRFDGSKASVRWLEWGQVGGAAKPIPEDKAQYKSLSWYGDKYVNYGRSSDPNDGGSAIIDRNPPDRDVKVLQYTNPCSDVAGFSCLGTCERIDALLRQARDTSVRDQREVVNGVECYVVDANGSAGNITAWIDPEHGYSIARVRQHRSKAAGHLDYGEPMRVNEVTFTLENKRFNRVDGIWLPVEFEWTSHTVYNGGRYNDEKRHAEITEVVLNPDHEALGTFVPDDIREGARAWMPPVTQIRYDWRAGKPVTRIDEDVVAELDRNLDKMLEAKGNAPEPNAPESARKAEQARAADQRQPRPHCGLYCLYSVLRLGGQKVDYRELVKAEYYGSHDGSSLAELRRGAVDYGLHAEVMRRLSTRGLRSCPYTAVLHVKPHAEAKQYDHYELFLGMEDGKARMLNPPEPVRLVSFAELAARWDGAGLLVSPDPLDMDRVTTVDRQRLLLYGVIGVLALVAFHMGRLIWYSVMGTASRRWTIGLTLGQGAGVGLAALIVGVAYHLVNDEALLANTTATASVQKAYAGSFVPRISAGQMRRLLATDTTIIDARRVSDYKGGHLDRAISLPVDANDALWKDRVASIPNGRRIVVYCQSAGCKFAENVSLRLMKEGFKDISIYRGGWNQWVAKNGDVNKTKVKENDPKGGHVWIPKRDPISKS